MTNKEYTNKLQKIGNELLKQNQDLKRIDLGVAKDQEIIAKESAAASAAAMSQGISGVVNTAGAAAMLSPLFGGKALSTKEQAAFEALMKSQSQGQ